MNGTLRMATAACTLLALAAAAFFLPVRDWTDGFEDRVESMDLAAGLLLFVAIYVVATLLLVPGWIFPVAAGVIFGMAWGLAAALAAVTASSIAAFLLARYLMSGPAKRLARRHRLFKAFDQAMDREGWRMVALLRLSPLLSFGMKSYFFGVTRVSLAPYIGGTLLGMLPGLLLKVWLGSAGRDVATRGGPLEWTLLATGLVATVVASVVVTRVTRARLRFERSRQPSTRPARHK